MQNTCSLICKLLEPILIRNLEHSALACIALTLRANNPIAENHMTQTVSVVQQLAKLINAWIFSSSP